MKVILVLVAVLAGLTACVPSKKYQELLDKEAQCAEELANLKGKAVDFESQNRDLAGQIEVQRVKLNDLIKDTSDLGAKYRRLQLNYDKMVVQNETLEKSFDKHRSLGAKETANLQAEIEAKNLELQRREDELHALELELTNKMNLLVERENRVNELEEAMQRKDNAIMVLKEKVANALQGFSNQGLTVEQKNGKIYVSMEAKLLFPSGSVAIQSEGKKAIIQLSHVLEQEKDLEIIVEGHTDTDKLKNTVHPKSNWELSVLRATAVVELMLDNSNMLPNQLMAAGRSEFIPVDKNDKAKNRRIEIIISPNLNELFEIIGK